MTLERQQIDFIRKSGKEVAPYVRELIDEKRAKIK